MLILSLGVPRSASTWLYNAAFQVLSHDGARVARGFADTLSAAEPLLADGADHVLIKSHTPDAALLERAARDGVFLLSIRDPRDAAVSSVAMFGGALPRRAQEISRSCNAVLHCATLPRAKMWRYEDGYHDDAPRSIGQIAQALGVRLSAEETETIAAAMSRKSVEQEIAALGSAPAEVLLHGHGDTYHKLTHWHAGHLRDGRVGKWRDLPDIDRELLNAALQPYVLAWDYGTPTTHIEWPRSCFIGADGAPPRGDISLKEPGYAFYGPYFALPAGMWHLTADLSFTGPQGDEGAPDIVFDVARNGLCVAHARPTVAATTSITFVFEHNDPLATMEFRMRLMEAKPGWRCRLRHVRLTRAHAEALVEDDVATQQAARVARA